MDDYLLSQINNEFIKLWNKTFDQDMKTRESVAEALLRIKPSREINKSFTAKKMGKMCFFTSGTCGHETYFEMEEENLSGKFSEGLSQVYENTFNVSNHLIKSAIICFPFDGSPLGFKHLFALLKLGVNVFPAGNRNLDFVPSQVVSTILNYNIEMLLTRPLEIEICIYIAKKRNIVFNSVLCILLCGEVIGDKRRNRIQEIFPNAQINYLYGLTELNAGFFSCEFGNYHLISNGQTIVDIKKRTNSKYYDLYFTSLRPELTAVRYITRDVVDIVYNCKCCNKNPALKILGRNSDEIAKDYFVVDLSEELHSLGIDHNLYADLNNFGRYRIIIKTVDRLSKDILADLENRFPSIEIINSQHNDIERYIPRTKSCTLHYGVSKYEL